MSEPNPLREALEAGEVILGGDVRTFSPTVIEIFGRVGLDYVWFDHEHAGPSPHDSHGVEMRCRAARLAGAEPVVRLPDDDPKLIGKVLDTGVRTLVIPQVDSGAAADRAVRAARYGDDAGPGGRGIGPGRATLYGCATDGYVDDQNAGVLLGVMIENADAVDAIEDVLAVPNLGFCFIGPADLSISMTGSLAPDDPAVTGAIESVLDAADAADVPVGRTFSTVEGAREAIERGYRMISLGKDVAAVHDAFTARVDALR